MAEPHEIFQWDVVDAPRVRDQEPKAASEAAQVRGRGARLILITLDAFGSLQLRADGRIAFRGIISSLQTAPQAAGRRDVRGGDSFSLPAGKWLGLALKPGGVTSSIKSHHVGQD